MRCLVQMPLKVHSKAAVFAFTPAQRIAVACHAEECNCVLAAASAAMWLAYTDGPSPLIFQCHDPSRNIYTVTQYVTN